VGSAVESRKDWQPQVLVLLLIIHLQQMHNQQPKLSLLLSKGLMVRHWRFKAMSPMLKVWSP
jgi:hypothetical protein